MMAITPRLEVGSRNDPGRRRRENEDKLFADPPSDPSIVAARGSLFAVADGMGGHQGGELAADRAITKVKEEYYYGDQSLDIPEALHRAILAANAAVYELSRTQSSRAGMGTTFVAAVVQGNRAVVANVGDSRAYIANADAIRRITTDHSLVQSLIDRGEITPDEARHHPRRNVITRSLGSEPTIRPDAFDVPLETDETLVLCSDGLSGQVRDEEIRAIVTRLSPQRAADALVRLANERGGPDNICVVVVGPRRSGLAGPVHPTKRFIPLVVALIAIVVIGSAYAAVIHTATPAPATATATVTTAPARQIATPNHLISAPEPPIAPAPSTPTIPIVEARPMKDGIAIGENTGSAQPTATLQAQTTAFSALPDRATPRPMTSPTSTPLAESTGKSSAPSPSASPIPSPTVTAPTPGVRPTLILYPAVTSNGSVLLSWNYNGDLAGDEMFDVRVWGNGAGDPSLGIANVKSSERTYLVGQGFVYGAGTYNWTIAVIRARGGVIGTVAQAVGPPLEFTWVPTTVGSTRPPLR